MKKMFCTNNRSFIALIYKVMTFLLVLITLCLVSNNYISTSNSNINKNIKKLNNNISYIDDYIDQNISEYYDEQEIPEDIKNNNLNLNYSSYPSNYFFDDGPKDDSKSNAIRISPYNGYIIGKLEFHDSINQIWYGVKERDEDYFRLSIREKLLYTFYFENPSDYRLSIIKYVNNEFICLSKSTFSIELDPGTYYLHIYTNDNSSIVEENYKINYISERVSNINNVDFEIAKEYKIAIWENEIWPSNSTRWMVNNSVLKTYEKTRYSSPTVRGFFDPLFSKDNDDNKATDEVFLDSMIYIFDKEIANDLYSLLDIIYNQITNVKDKYPNKNTQLNIISDGVSLIISSILNNIPLVSVIVDISDIVLTFIKLILPTNLNLSNNMDDQYFSTVLRYIEKLKEACTWYDDNKNDYIGIPRFYTFSKDIIYSSTKYKYLEWKRNYIFIPEFVDTNISYTFKHNGKINAIQQFADLNSYYGEIRLFKLLNEFEDYIKGNKDLGDSTTNIDFHYYKNIIFFDETYHKKYCECGQYVFEEHDFIIDGLNYICNECDYKIELKFNTITKNDYNFLNSYNNVLKSQSLNLSNIKCDITYLRAANINNNIVLSAKNKNTTTAYIEYYFNKYIVELIYEFGLWSENEYLAKNSSIRLEGYDEDYDIWFLIREFAPNKMSTSYTDLKQYIDIFEIPIKSFRYIISTNQVNNDNNRGRVVLGNMVIKSYENEHFHNFINFEKYNNNLHKAICNCGYFELKNHKTGSTYKVGSRTYANCLECGQLVEVDTGIIVTPTSINVSMKKV